MSYPGYFTDVVAAEMRRVRPPKKCGMRPANARSLRRAVLAPARRGPLSLTPRFSDVTHAQRGLQPFQRFSAIHRPLPFIGRWILRVLPRLRDVILKDHSMCRSLSGHEH